MQPQQIFSCNTLSEDAWWTEVVATRTKPTKSRQVNFCKQLVTKAYRYAKQSHKPDDVVWPKDAPDICNEEVSDELNPFRDGIADVNIDLLAEFQQYLQVCKRHRFVVFLDILFYALYRRATILQRVQVIGPYSYSEYRFESGVTINVKPLWDMRAYELFGVFFHELQPYFERFDEYRRENRSEELTNTGLSNMVSVTFTRKIIVFLHHSGLVLFLSTHLTAYL
jgi:hypothetical protein